MFVVHNKRGDIGLEAATFGEAQYIAICLGMHREDVSSMSLVLTTRANRQSYYNLSKLDGLQICHQLTHSTDRITTKTSIMVHALQCGQVGGCGPDEAGVATF